MSVRREIPDYDGFYFITITCARWIKLFDITNSYDIVYNWFDYLKDKGHFINGYVIMPNHIHALIGFCNTKGQSINSIVGNGKRFMAYEIVKRLKEKNESLLLEQLASFVNVTDSRKGKIHEVFEPSFDWKECKTNKFIEQKLNYIHDNPCRGEWNLAEQPEDYLHSSAKFYITGEQGGYQVTDIEVMEDIDLTKPKLN